MSRAHPDAAASAPHAPPPGFQAATADADCRRRLRRWLGRLADIGDALMGNICNIIAVRRQDGRPPVDVYLVEGFTLVERAHRWIDALRARLATEPMAREPVAREDLTPEALAARLAAIDSAVDGPLHSDIWDPPHRQPFVPPALDDCIAGLPTAQVVRQICADLKQAALLVGYEALGRQARKIAAELRALLDDEAEPWEGLLPSLILRGHRMAAERDDAAPPGAARGADSDPDPGPGPGPDSG